MNSEKVDFNLGNVVLCDLCNKDYTHDTTSKGGITFGSKAVCPDCTPTVEASANKYGEQHHIKHRCPPDMTFRDWVINVLREGKPGIVEIISL